MGTADEAVAYCSKPDTRHPEVEGPFTMGQRAPGQGYRSDMASLTELVVSGKSTKEIATEMPGMFMRFHGGIAALKAALEDDVQPDVDFQPRQWQQHLLDLLAADPDDRHIIWVTDTVGGQGKSRLTMHLIRNHGAIALSGKQADMELAYCNNRAKIAVFDITRAAAEYSSHLYSMAEALKNGFYMVKKYQSRQVTFRPPHVIFFSNSTWDRSKFSRDRVIEIDLDTWEAQQAAQRFM